MVKKEKITRLSLLSKKIQDAAATANEPTKIIENQDPPDLANLVVEFNHVKWLIHVWTSNLCNDMEELEAALLVKMIDAAKEVA